MPGAFKLDLLQPIELIFVPEHFQHFTQTAQWPQDPFNGEWAAQTLLVHRVILLDVRAPRTERARAQQQPEQQRGRAPASEASQGRTG